MKVMGYKFDLYLYIAIRKDADEVTPAIHFVANLLFGRRNKC